jgi:type I restriction enzyme R subunit
VQRPSKTAFKLFDFFANCEYVEEEFNYDEVLQLPQSRGKDELRASAVRGVATGGD